jgi:hypothetical protein
MAKAKKHSTPPINYQFGALPVEIGSSHPGDSKVQARTRAFLHRLMTDHLTGTPKTKPEYRAECRERFKISDREFDRLWREEVARTGATAFRKRGPRGPRRSRE